MFINYLLLALAAVSHSAYGVFGGIYNRKKASPYKYCLCIAATALLFFVFSSGFKFEFRLDTLFWAVLFGICYFIANVLYQVSIRLGGVSLTALVVSYSLIVPTTFALIAYGVEPFWTFYVGLGLLFVSLFFVGYPRKGSNVKIKPLWFVTVALTLLTNGACGLFQAHYQRLSGGKFGSEFMIMALSIVIVLMLFAIFFDRKTEYQASTLRALWGVGAGVFNGLLNFLSMYLVVVVGSSLYYPVSSAMGLIVTVFASVIFFKEKPDKMSIVAIIIGLISVVLLNL